MKIFLSAMLFFLVFGQLVHAQDIHFSQFIPVKSFYNPAYTGDHEGRSMFTGDIRKQWNGVAEAFRYLFFSADKPFEIGHHSFATGISIQQEHSGQAGYTHVKVAGALSTILRKGNVCALFALQVGWGRKSFSASDLTSPSQFDYETGLFNPSLASHESNMFQSRNRLFLTPGAVMKWRKDPVIFEAGLAVHEINRPYASFTDRSIRSYIKYVSNVCAAVKLNESLILHAVNVNTRMKGWTENLLGVETELLFPEKKIRSLNGSVYLRTTNAGKPDATIIGLQVTSEKYQVRISYDITCSAVRKITSGGGATEISFSYTLPRIIYHTKHSSCERF